MSETTALEQEIEAALRRGDLLAAYDRSVSAILAGADSERLRYLELLALARMGDTERALQLYERYRLAESSDVDCLALRGRLLKDAALGAPDDARPALLAAASAVYHDVFERTADPFPGINAASLALLAGDKEQAQRLAARVLALPAVIEAGDYYAMATAAEARLVLGEVAAAAKAMRSAAAMGAGDAGARASTYRQLRLIADAMALAASEREAVLGPARPAPVLMYTGHMFRGGDVRETALAKALDAFLDRHGIRVAYGSLACGTDILVAEALLRRGVELNVVLPFAREDFERQSVRLGGAHWLPRFEACLDGARSVDLASHAGFVGDDQQFSYGSAVAMGLARLRARHLDARPLQLAIWDGSAPSGHAGTVRDMEVWRELGGEVEILDPGPVDRRLDRPPPSPPARWERQMRAILFSDYAGFSRLDEATLPQFWEFVMGCAGAVLERNKDTILGANTWGDALFAYTADVTGAARVALELQSAVASAAAEYPEIEGAGMRFGIHFGPVYAARDPVTGRDNVFGTEVTRAARIEPVTPTGDVYATHQFAAMLALTGEDEFVLGYVGAVRLAKEHGELKMFRLTRR